MAAIADSCAVVAFLNYPGAAHILPRATAVMTSERIWVPAEVVLEITRLITGQRLAPIPIGLLTALRMNRFEPLLSTWEDAELAANLPPIHRDPIDRSLVALALNRRLPIITSDRIIPQYGVTTIW